jgi:hypothetical protein
MSKPYEGALYWTGPYGILVPRTVDFVPWIDGVNDMSQCRIVTQMEGLDDDGNPIELAISQDLYREKYAYLGEDGLWYWRGV